MCPQDVSRGDTLNYLGDTLNLSTTFQTFGQHELQTDRSCTDIFRRPKNDYFDK